jgi:DNA anti-recombination protein RmuC
MRIATLPAVGLLLAAATSLAAGQDSAGPAGHRDQLRQLIEQRFTERAQEELKLSDEQTSRLRETNRKFGGKRRELEARQMAIRDAMSDQLRPGVAANRDSLSKLTDAAADIRVQYAQSFRDELRETSKYLDPVQRAQLLTMRERLMRRVREVRSERGRREGTGEGYRYRRRAPDHDSGGAHTP